MGNICCTNPGFTSLDVEKESGSQIVQRLRERPELLCVPRPAAFLGLNDSALHLAAERKSVDAAQHIFSFLAGADTEALQAALRPYCRRKQLQPPTSFVAAARMAANMCNNKGQTPLMYACYSDCPEIVKLLLEQGADPWVGDNCGCRNALHYAAMAGSAVCVEALMKNIMPHMLVRHGLRYINCRSLSGLTPLHYCVFFEKEAALRQLLTYDPNINAASSGESYDTYGSYDIYSTPLHFAALQDSAAIARLLLLHYARRRRLGTLLDPRLRANSAGNLPWQVAHSRTLSALLHPAAPLGEVLGREGEEALAGLGGGDAAALGPPALAALAAAALRQKLLAEVEVIERECVEEAALHRQLTGRPAGLLPCATPRRGAVTAPDCSGGARDLLRIASRGVGRSPSRRARSLRPAAMSTGAVMPVSPRRAPTLDRQPHPSDAATAGGGSGGGGGGLDGGSPRPRGGSGAPATGRGLRTSPATATATAASSSRNCGPSRGPSSRERWQQQQLQQQLQQQQQQLQQQRQLQPNDGGGQAWLPGLAPANGSGNGSGYPAALGASGGGGGSVYDITVPPGASPSALGALNPRGASLTAAGGGGGGGGVRLSPFNSAAANITVDVAGSDLIPTLPGGASPLSPFTPGPLPDAPSTGFIPLGGSPTATLDAPSAVLPGGGSDEVCRLTVPYCGNNLMSPATSLVTGSCVEFDPAAAARATAANDAGGGESGFGVVNGDSDDGGGGGGGLLGDSDDDDGMCNVCFARREAVMAAACRHGLCTACAGEMCRALVSKPLLCPFCRRPVGDFVRIVKPPPPPPPARRR